MSTVTDRPGRGSLKSNFVNDSGRATAAAVKRGDASNGGTTVFPGRWRTLRSPGTDVLAVSSSPLHPPGLGRNPDSGRAHHHQLAPRPGHLGARPFL